MRARCCLGAAALEVSNRENLQMLVGSTMGQKPKGICRPLGGKELPKFVDLGKRIGSMIIFQPRREGTFPFIRHQLQC